MADLEVPSSSEDVFLSLGEDVNVHRPLLTGDVVTSVDVPILGGAPQTVVIVAHPCSMRKNGVELADLIQVAPVAEYGQAGDSVWRRHYKVFPFDGLHDLDKPVARLELTTLAKSTGLLIENRIACTSRHGINLLRQRLVHHLTRVVVETWQFDEEAAGTYEEIDLWEEWTQESAQAEGAFDDAAQAFHEWIRAGEPGNSRQDRLADPQTAAAVRREADLEIRRLYG